MNDASSHPPTSSGDVAGWERELAQHATLLDGVDVAMCAFDLQDRAVAWNRSFLRLFPEHEGQIFRGEPYRDNLRRFYTARLAPQERGDIESYIAAGVARQQAVPEPYELEHRGGRLQAASTPIAGRGRIQVWRPVQAPQAAAAPEVQFAPGLGRDLLERVPVALLVCEGDGRILWTNSAFRQLSGLYNLQEVTGATLPMLYDEVWRLSGAASDVRDHHGAATLAENLRLSGASFELPMPDGGYCRVLARPAGEGAVFYALIDVSALKRYEAALQLTLDNAGRGIVRYDATGRILLFNRQAIDLLELPDGLLNETATMADVMNFQKVRGDPGGIEGLPQTGSPLEQLFQPGRYLRRNLAGRVLEVTTRTLPDGGAVRTYTDVTDYVEAQGALGEKSRALRITLESMDQGLSVIDSVGRVVFWNRRYQELLDFPDHVLAGQPTMEQLVRFQTERGDFGPDFEYVHAVARRYVAVGDKVAPVQGPESYLRKTKDGRTLEVITRPLPDGSVVRTFTDLTAYVQSQEALATSQAQLSALVRNLPDRVWLKDAEGVFLLSNPAHQRHHKMDESAILGRTAAEVFGDQAQARQRPTDEQAMASETPISFEYHDFGPDGELRCAEVVKVAMRDDGGRCIGVLGIAHDITARKRQEVALIRAKEEAQEASGAKTRFLSSMSHEIRTPMNAILGMLTLLRGSGLNPRQQDYAGKAQGAAVSLLGLLNDILDFSKIEAGKMTLDERPFSLEAVLADLSVILSANVGERDIEILYDLDPQVPDALVGDDMRLRQILINLGGNAVKFTQRGEVVVRTLLVDRDATHATVEFSVEDTGIGITTEEQERLFTDYAQASGETSRNFGGTGLGLGICRRLTELMDSRLQVASTPRVGSRFWFAVRLPLAPVVEEDVASGPPARVLVVDDNPHARDALAALCHAAGWRVETAADGEQAVARVQSAAAMGMAYDAVFVDWLMPRVDGWETCARIRALSLPARTPLVVMVTGQGRELVAQRPGHEQALLDGYLVKPVTPGMLREAMRRARAAPETATVAPPPAPQALAGLRLLLAEDNEVNQQIAVELLSRRGAEVEVAPNGAIAVQRLADGGCFDAVLMDVQMPVMDGLDATRMIRRLPDRARLPIIAMTANAMDTDRAACLAAGMNDHVAKPFAVDLVVQVILRHVHGTAAPLAAPVAAPAATSLPVFDRAGALERLGDDESLLDVVLRVFRGNLETAARQIENAGRSSSPDEMRRLFHSVKGMAANVGAMALSAAAADADQALRDDPQAPVEPLARAVGVAIADVLRELGPGD
ncbi:MAG TPA: PAS-domain containing protein [Ramlibacter sp.]